jgi:hypothetical protein
VKGFITNLTFIKEFCISVCEYIRNVNSYKEAFVGNISQTIHVDFAEYLKAYRITLGGEVKGNYNTYTDEYLYHYFRVVSAKDQPISHDFFSSFMKAYEEEKAACPEVHPLSFSGTSPATARTSRRCASTSSSASSTPSTSPSSSRSPAASTASPSPG